MSRQFIFLGIIFLCLWGLVLYGATFDNEFVFDDLSFIVDNPHIKDITNFAAVREAMPHASRFVPLYTFALNYHFHQLDVFGYHLVNFLLHVTNSLLVWWLAGMLLGFWSERETFSPKAFSSHDRTWIAFMTALLFLSHPLQTQAVSYITQRFASLATFFYLLSLCLYLKGRGQNRKGRRGYFYFGGALVSGLLGMFTKEILITLPLCILFTEGFILQKVFVNKRERGPHANRQWLWATLPVLLFCLVVPAIFSFRPSLLFSLKSSESHLGDTLTLPTYLLTQARVWVVFLRLFIFPVNLNLDYDFPMSHGLWAPPTTFLSLLLLGGFFALAFRIKRRNRLIAYGLFWFFITLSANLVPRVNVIFEHKMYLPSVGLCLALALGGFTLMRNKKNYVRLFAVLILLLSVLTIRRNAVWQDEVTIWSDVVEKSPHKARPKINLGTGYVRKKEYDLGIKYLSDGLALNPRSFQGYAIRGTAYSKKKLYSLALADFETSLEIEPMDFRTYQNRAESYADQGLEDLAIADISKVLQLNPFCYQAYFVRGSLFARRKKLEQAMEDFNRALLLNKYNEVAYNRRGYLYALQGRYDLAAADFRKALSINPQYLDARNNLGNVYFEQGKDKTAMATFQKALEQDQSNDQSYYHLSNVFMHQGRIDDALKAVKKAIELNPTSYEAYGRQGILLGMSGQASAALEAFNHALQINPDYYEGYCNRGYAFLLSGKFSEARKDFDKAITINAQSADIFNKRGLAAFFLKDYDAALKDFDRSLALVPDSGMVYYNRATAYEAKGEKEKALTDFLKAESLGYKLKKDDLTRVGGN